MMFKQMPVTSYPFTHQFPTSLLIEGFALSPWSLFHDMQSKRGCFIVITFSFNDIDKPGIIRYFIYLYDKSFFVRSPDSHRARRLRIIPVPNQPDATGKSEYAFSIIRKCSIAALHSSSVISIILLSLLPHPQRGGELIYGLFVMQWIPIVSVLNFASNP